MLGPGEAQRFAGPIVALIDRQTRSAKEELAYELRARGLARLVGEPTAGAFLGAGFELISDDIVLMLPGTALPTYTALIEQQPVEPDVFARSAGPYAAGNDPLLTAGLDEAVRLVRERGPGFTRGPK
jgi:carboxyl-terminal processing protease